MTSQGWGKDERWTEQSTERSLMKTCSRLLRTSDWGKGSPSNRTTILSTQPRQCRSDFRKSLWMSLSGQPEPRLEPDRISLERPENSCAATLPIQSDRAWEDLHRIMEEIPQIQVCQACSVILKKRRGCNRCQRCFNKVLSKGFEYLCKCNILFVYL